MKKLLIWFNVDKTHMYHYTTMIFTSTVGTVMNQISPAYAGLFSETFFSYILISYVIDVVILEYSVYNTRFVKLGWMKY